MATVDPSYYEVKTEEQCLKDTKKFYLDKLNKLEEEEIRIVNIIASCNERLLQSSVV